MGSEGTAQRPFCHCCSKPARICLCDRLKSPPLDNSIAVTILQHSREKTHPLNSSRVARLGLKNLCVVPVTDVIFQAQFLVRPLEPNQDCASSSIAGNHYEMPVWDERLDSSLRRSVTCKYLTERLSFHPGMSESEEELNLSQDISDVSNDYDQIGETPIDDEVTSSFSKYTVTYSSKYIMVAIDKTAKPDIGWILNYPVGKAAISNGFMVRKLQRKKSLLNSEELKDSEEFNLVIPSGSALLFPSSNAIELAEVDHEVKHLIVLDGTWAKARRMYYENPWLKLLPHLKLDQRKESLYSDVRHQPKAGYLSTVESIVCALKALGNDMEGLDEILEVFGSMIKDQRRCKDEKFKAMSKS
ncbi:uncharacterized protein LOC110093643 [Dendrobium catenatum]|uniref:tRNA-uridine aminocarboxypropyltransferase n=1 Tax=Dendrobium catenatum TaxID=906689 RepID=A0A2I0VQ25_9ASPA|nr:uncharacterized protein LOC110093643 [Dendrobium catenatum]PKU65512.1 hypothetical protein MA16_Dca012234 [Dendrobium catenatum]